MSPNEINYTNNQRDKIYRDMLQPIKLKISHILLYDSEMAIEFLKEYNEIVKNPDDVNILRNISSLEFKIGEYEKTKGNKMKVQGQNRAILQDMEELEMKNYQLSIDEFVDAFLILKEKYSKIESVDFQERDVIENKFYEIQIILITRFLKEKQYADLQDIIQTQDKTGLNIAISGKIHEFMQSEDLRVKNKAQKISNIMITNENALYSRKMWELLEELQIGKNKDNEKIVFDTMPTTSTALTVVSEKKGTFFKDKLLRLFSKEPQLPLQLADLKKINIDWLAKNMPQSILEEIEIKRLHDEGKRVDKLFVPDVKTPIYDIFVSKEDGFIEESRGKDISRDGEKFLKILSDKKDVYVDNNGIKKQFIIEQEKSIFKDGCVNKDYYIKIISGDEEIRSGEIWGMYDKFFLRYN